MWKLIILLIICFLGFMTLSSYLWFSMHALIRELNEKLHSLSKQMTLFSLRNLSLHDEFTATKEKVEILMRVLKDRLVECGQPHQKEPKKERPRKKTTRDAL